MTCTNEAHYPQPVSPGEYDAHLHAAGRVQLVDGVPAVVDGSACSQRRWRTIVVDPPWDYSDLMSSGVRGWVGFGQRDKHKGKVRGAGNHYGLLSQGDLLALPVGEWAEEQAHLYIWTTNAFVFDARPLMDAWGFEYKTMLVWGKPQIGMGRYYRNNTELILFGVRGSLKALRHNVPTLFMADRKLHSEKPQAFYDMVETMSPGPYLDVFARKQRMGWDVAGNEVYSAIPELAYQPPQATDAKKPRTDDVRGL